MTQQRPRIGSWGLWHLVGFFGVLLLIVIVVVVAFTTFPARPLQTWLILLALFVALTLVISHAYTGRWLGILIDERRKYSLSRLQMALWTVMILSAFITAVLANVQLYLIVYVTGAVEPPRVMYFSVGSRVIDALDAVGVVDADSGVASPEFDLSQINLAETLRDGQQIYVAGAGETTLQAVLTQIGEEEAPTQPTTPLSVQIPGEVWVLFGISTTSLVASPLIKTQKQAKIQKNGTASEAKLSDLLRGEESGNFLQLDLAKVQMFYFTLIVLGAYAIALASVFLNTQNAITSLPALDGGVVAMLGVSHAGYLTNKAVPKGDATSQPVPEGAAPLLPEDDQGAAG